MPETMSITSVAEAFFNACETGKGWESCVEYCTPSATFSAQAEPLLDVKTLAQYSNWMKGILSVLPDANYELRSFATDNAQNNVAAYAVFHGTHTGQGGPVPPTGQRMSTDYVYVMQFEDGKIAHMTKIWNSGLTFKELGWV
jgi:steroid delta-isomerase-like uncharacterized protein